MDRERSVERFLPLRPVEFDILLSLAAGERHGYGIIHDAEARALGAIPDVGTLYRALRRLEDQQHDRRVRPPRVAGRPGRTTKLLSNHRARPTRGAGRGAAAARADPGGAIERAARRERNMSARASMPASERWFRLLLRLYPADFRDEMGARSSRRTSIAAGRPSRVPGTLGLAGIWFRALVDSVLQRNRRAHATRGPVATRRQLGPRHRARRAPTRAARLRSRSRCSGRWWWASARSPWCSRSLIKLSSSRCPTSGRTISTSCGATTRRSSTSSEAGSAGPTSRISTRPAVRSPRLSAIRRRPPHARRSRAPATAIPRK